MLEQLGYTQRLGALLGLVPWRLRRDMAREAQALSADKSSNPTSVAPDSIAAAPDGVKKSLDSAAGAYVQAVQLAQDVQVRAADRLTLISIAGYGSWWLPALSAQDAGMSLFRSAAETELLHTLLNAAGLAALSAHFRHIDEHFAAGGFLSERLPPDTEELLSLPKPWLLCGAIAGRQAGALAGEYVPLSLHHPLLLLTNPQQKRNAWQQILAYRQVIHV